MKVYLKKKKDLSLDGLFLLEALKEKSNNLLYIGKLYEKELPKNISLSKSRVLVQLDESINFGWTISSFEGRFWTLDKDEVQLQPEARVLEVE